jgi:hypothetical protein
MNKGRLNRSSSTGRGRLRLSQGNPASATVIVNSHQRSSGRKAAHLLQITGILSSPAVSAAHARIHSSLPSNRSTRFIPVCQRPVKILAALSLSLNSRRAVSEIADQVARVRIDFGQRESQPGTGEIQTHLTHQNQQ